MACNTFEKCTSPLDGDVCLEKQTSQGRILYNIFDRLFNQECMKFVLYFLCILFRTRS